MSSSGRLVAALAVLGVVFGDIGTSPLYVLHTAFEPGALVPVQLNQTAVFGVVSLVVWTITVIVTILYVGLLTRADHDGEGGLLALVSLLRPRQLTGRVFAALFAVGVFGAALFFADSIITPAISVLSAVEGLKTASPGLATYVVPIAAVILSVLFVLQRRGSSRVGHLFGPVMAVWFAVLAVLGVVQLVQAPQILEALSPSYAAAFIAAQPLAGFLSLGAVVLAVTGAEALYADIGHFGRRPIVACWMLLVFPALVLDYLGQGALLSRQPSAVHDPLVEMTPEWARLPFVVLATLATIIASQAVISGAFTVTQQAAQLGYLPQVRVFHTSASNPGQVYLPFVNWFVGVGVLALVVGFQSSSRLAAAYGLAVTGTIGISTALFFIVQWQRTHWPRWWLVTGAAVFLTVVGALLTANMVKVVDGGWVPIVMALLTFVVLTTWHRGQSLTSRRRDGVAGTLDDFAQALKRQRDLRRVDGCAVFLSQSASAAPLALRANVKHNRVLHCSTVLLVIETSTGPHPPSSDRVVAKPIGDGTPGLCLVRALPGYRDRPDPHEILLHALDHGLRVDREDVDRASYFFSQPDLRVTRGPGMARWRKHLYVAIEKLAPDPAEFFDLPRDAVVIMGADVEI